MNFLKDTDLKKNENNCLKYIGKVRYIALLYPMACISNNYIQKSILGTYIYVIGVAPHFDKHIEVR